MKDTYRHKGQRKKLIEALQRKGIRDQAVLDAMASVPRHFFLDPAFEEWSYQDKPFPIGHDQTISQPFTVARMTELLRLEQRMKVLEIGTGSGYQAAILSAIGGRVFTIERQKGLYLKARKRLQDLGIPVRCFYRDGYKGLPEFAPFDRIIVTAGAPEVPQPLLDQLSTGGIMVIPVGKKVQKMLRITRTGEDRFETEKAGEFRFVPFLGGLESEEG